jgi:hypothetical protein
MPEFDYVRDGTETHRRSFAVIRAEADLARFLADLARSAAEAARVAARMTQLPEAGHARV